MDDKEIANGFLEYLHQYTDLSSETATEYRDAFLQVLTTEQDWSEINHGSAAKDYAEAFLEEYDNSEK